MPRYFMRKIMFKLFLIVTAMLSIEAHAAPAGGDSDPWFAKSPRAVGESVTVEGIKVEVTATSSTGGDTVRVSADGVQVVR